MNEETLPTAQAVPEGTRTLTKFTAEHAHEVGLPSPEAINFMTGIANMLAGSALITPDMMLPKDAVLGMEKAGWTPEQIATQQEKIVRSNAMAKMLVGREMGMQAMESLQDIDIVKGRIFTRYPQLINQLERKGYKVKWLERSNTRAAMELTKDGHEPETFEFTIDDAKRAGLTGSPSQQYEKRPRVMLTARVASEAYRTTGGRGNVYTPEEKEEIFGTQEADDQRRVDKLTGGMGDFKVGLKVVPKAETVPEQQPEPVKTVEVKAEAPESVPEPVKDDPKADPVIEFWVCSISKKSGKDVPTPVLGEVPQKHQDSATLRARALCNEKGVTFVVIKTQDGKFVDEVSICNPLSKPAPAPAAAPAPAPAPTPRPVATGDPKAAAETIKARFNEFATMLELPGKTAVTRFKAFVAGYLGVSLKDLPNDPLEWMEAVEELGYSLGYDPNEFRSGPESAGKLARQRRLDILGYIKKEWTDTKTQALALSVARKYGYTVNGFQQWAEFIGLEPKMIDGIYQSLPTKDANAFLRAFKVTREAGVLPKLAKDHNLEIATIIDQIEQRGLKCALEEAEPKDVESAIKGFTLAVREEAKAAAAPTPDSPSDLVNEPSGAEPPAAGDGPEAAESGEESDEGQDNIFDGLF